MKNKKEVTPNEFNSNKDQENNFITQNEFDLMVEKECQEMGFNNYEEYEYFLKTRGK